MRTEEIINKLIEQRGYESFYHVNANSLGQLSNIKAPIKQACDENGRIYLRNVNADKFDLILLTIPKSIENNPDSAREYVSKIEKMLSRLTDGGMLVIENTAPTLEKVTDYHNRNTTPFLGKAWYVSWLLQSMTDVKHYTIVEHPNGLTVFDKGAGDDVPTREKVKPVYDFVTFLENRDAIINPVSLTDDGIVAVVSEPKINGTDVTTDKPKKSKKDKAKELGLVAEDDVNFSIISHVPLIEDESPLVVNDTTINMSIEPE